METIYGIYQRIGLQKEGYSLLTFKNDGGTFKLYHTHKEPLQLHPKFLYELKVVKGTPNKKLMSYKLHSDLELVLLKNKLEMPNLWNFWMDIVGKPLSEREDILTRLQASATVVKGLLKEKGVDKPEKRNQIRAELKILLSRVTTERVANIDASKFREDPLFQAVLEKCPKVGIWLGWDQYGFSNLGKTQEHWRLFKLNPYRFPHESMEGLDAKEKKIMKGVRMEMAKIDQTVLDAKYLGIDDERRIEYILYGAIANGVGCLRNQAACFSQEEILDKVKTARNQKIKKDQLKDKNGDEVNTSLTKNLPEQEKLVAYLEKVKNGEQGLDARCCKFLKYDRQFFYERSTLNHERGLSAIIAEFISNNEANSLEGELNLFKNSHPKVKGSLTEEQNKLLLSLMDRRFAVVVGSAGTGKTTVMSILAAFLLWTKKFDVYICSYVGKAAVRATDVLKEKVAQFQIGIDSIPSAITIHKLCASGVPGQKSKKILIVDEIGTAPFNILHQGIKMISPDRMFWFGDEKQLPPILGQRTLEDTLDVLNFPDAENVLPFVFKLNTIIRGLGENENKIAQLASGLWAKDLKPQNWVQDLKRCNNITLIEGEEWQDMLKETIAKALSVNATFYQDYPLIIASTHEQVKNINSQVRPLWLNKVDQLSAVTYRRVVGENPNINMEKIFYSGDRIMCKKNVYKNEETQEIYVESEEDDDMFEVDVPQVKMISKMIIANGEFGVVNRTSDTSSIVYITKLDKYGEKIGEELGLDMEIVTLGYAITINKAQGSEHNHVLMFLQFWNYKRLFYTAFTRQKKKSVICVPGERELCKIIVTSKFINTIDYRSFFAIRIVEQLTTNTLATHNVNHNGKDEEELFDDADKSDDRMSESVDMDNDIEECPTFIDDDFNPDDVNPNDMPDDMPDDYNPDDYYDLPDDILDTIPTSADDFSD